MVYSAQLFFNTACGTNIIIGFLALIYTFIHLFCFVFLRTTALATKLTEFNLGSDKHTFLSKLIKSIFSSYLESYIDMEREYLRNRGAMILQRYYDSKNHQKRAIGSGRSDLDRICCHTLNSVIDHHFLGKKKYLTKHLVTLSVTLQTHSSPIAM